MYKNCIELKKNLYFILKKHRWILFNFNDETKWTSRELLHKKWYQTRAECECSSDFDEQN